MEKLNKEKRHNFRTVEELFKIGESIEYDRTLRLTRNRRDTANPSWFHGLYTDVRRIAACLHQQFTISPALQPTEFIRYLVTYHYTFTHIY